MTSPQRPIVATIADGYGPSFRLPGRAQKDVDMKSQNDNNSWT